MLKNKVTLYLPILVHPRIILISRVRLGEVVMKHCQDATFDVKNVFWFILLAINLSNLSRLEIKFDWFFKPWSKVSRNWRDLQGVKTARCPVDFVQQRLFDLSAKGRNRNLRTDNTLTVNLCYVHTPPKHISAHWIRANMYVPMGHLGQVTC